MEAKVRYGLVWEDKIENIEIEFETKLPVLTAVPRLDVPPSEPTTVTLFDDPSKPSIGHLLIEADNLHALKVMQYTHAGRVDVIYIDPPYNTGNKDFVYNDRYVDKEDTFRHSMWLSFISKRLELARNLLSDKGVIFMSIDDNEQAQLKLLCDRIFGESNFIANLPTIMNLKGNNDQFGFAGTHEYTLVYGKNITLAKINLFEIDDEEVDKNWDTDDYGMYKKGANLKATGTNAPREKRPNLYYPIFFRNNNDFYTSENDEPENSKDKIVI